MDVLEFNSRSFKALKMLKIPKSLKVLKKSLNLLGCYKKFPSDLRSCCDIARFCNITCMHFPLA